MRQPMRSALRLILVLGIVLSGSSCVQAFPLSRHLPYPGRNLAGQLLDFTSNHGTDRRIYSSALGEKRDLYVYLPPGYCKEKRYPLIYWFHGIEDDEKGFVRHCLVQIDSAIACGRLTPAIIVIPDGSVRGRPGHFSPHSGFLNTRAGCFEDFLFHDVDDFVKRNFSIRPEREAHVLAGISFGGAAAYHHAIVRRDEFGIVFGIFPPLNPRWMGADGRYFAKFDPNAWGWREHYNHGLEPVGKYVGGLIRVPWRRLVHPLYGSGSEVVPQMSRDNPIEMLDRYNLRPGELEMLIAYVGRDQFNIDAQVESFLYRSAERGLKVHVLYDARGKHDATSALSFLPGILDWLAPRLNVQLDSRESDLLLRPR
jgi:S-formylglutathione hydrolase FrmB